MRHMKLGIMQPYFFPYVSYFQLIHAVDCFLIYDDVNYIKQGWINRNRILLNNNAHVFTLNLIGASSFKRINQIITGNNKGKLLKTVEQAYAKAPYYENVMPVIGEILQCEETNLARYLASGIIMVCQFLGINTKILLSSEIEKQQGVKGQEKIIHICQLFKADTYINAIGGTELYSKERFSDEGIDLFFIRSKDIRYKQFKHEFIPWLSIIDVMMFNSKASIIAMLGDIELI
jgi:hypothetical protein